MKILAEQRSAQLRDHFGFKSAGVYDPPGVGGTGVIYVLHDINNPEAYGGLPKNPTIPAAVSLWKHPLKWLGNIAMVGGLIGLFVHYLKFGPKPHEPEDVESGGVKPPNEPTPPITPPDTYPERRL